ncbi:hypothetical protein PG996_000312 [Apiospora saccharicola]|uniref:Uncharacterized protein n=1 Tax=Apiospora saccharicola TaxID=335842 RepID=A0ABR1WG89_9PEZI
MADGMGLAELGYQPSGNSSSTHCSSLSHQTSADSLKSKKSLGIFGSMSRKIKGIRSTSTSKSVTRSPSSSRPLPPFSLKQFSSLKKRHGIDPPTAARDVSRKAATVRCYGTDRTPVNVVPRRTSVGAVKAPRLEIPKDIGGDFTLSDGA